MSEQQKTAGYKVVPVEPTDEMVWKAEEDSPEFHHGDPWYGSEPPSEGQIRAIYTAMLEAAQQPPKLSDERILEIAMSDDVSLVEYQGPGVRPRITVHNSIGGVYALARAIEREILGGSEK